MKIKNIFLTLIAIFSPALDLVAHEQTDTKNPIITIFVHGSRPQLPAFFYKMGNYYFLSDLHHVDEYMDMAEIELPIGIIEGLRKSGYVDFEHLYFFGWSGRVSFDVRKQTAKKLKKAIEALLSSKKYADYSPEIHIITHSHGGNVALNLAHELELNQSAVTIDELILTAVPVQPQTKEYINSKNIGKVYSHYSEDDWTQIVDPQGLLKLFSNQYAYNNNVFSEHTFDHHEKLTQMCIKINNIDPWHITFIDYYPPLPYLKDLHENNPHKYPYFLPDLGDIMHKAKDSNTQKRIATHKKPITVNIDTHQQYGSSKRIQITHPTEQA